MKLSARTGLPKQIIRGNRTNFVLEGLIQRRPEVLAATQPEDRVFGFRLPPFQRPAVWSPAQQARYIESVYMGFPIGELLITQDDPDGNAVVRYLLDGQQRLRALEAWIDGQLTVQGVRFTELAERDRDVFLMTPIGVMFLESGYSMETLREIYERLNFGGTPHADEHHPGTFRRPG